MDTAKKYTQIQFIQALHLSKLWKEIFCFISNFHIIPLCSIGEVWYLQQEEKSYKVKKVKFM